jgi:hypothetical protein
MYVCGMVFDEFLAAPSYPGLVEGTVDLLMHRRFD